VRIDVLPAKPESDLVRFEVQDTGMGIPRHEQASIFEPFTRLPGSAEAGTGLGLDIARRNVEAMGGKIGVSSAPGVGSSFWIELPLRVVPGAGPALREPHSGEAGAEGAAPTFQGNVLLVDDNETNLMLGTMILERLGVAVTRASSGQAAVAAASSGEHDLVLMDINMPDIDGYEATRRIRERFDAKALPVVALTAYASSVEQEQSAASGMNGYLTKPIDRERLIEALQTWLAVRDVDRVVGEGVAEEGELNSLVDLSVLQELFRQIGFDNLATVIGKFTDEADRRWQALTAACDGAVRAREAHTLASTCGSFGLPTVADRFRNIEKLAGAGADTAALELAETGSDLTRGLKELKTAVAELAPES
jgi:CheY-like chemotaxis protein